MNVVITETLRGKIRIIFYAASMGVIAGMSSSSQALQPDQICAIYTFSDSGVPNSLMSRMKQNNDEAAEICTNKEGDIIEYTSASKAYSYHFGVCEFELRKLKGQGKVYKSAGEYMALAEGSCPVQSDRSYIGVYGLSEGLFKLLMKFASNIKASPKSFDDSIEISKSVLKDKEAWLATMRSELTGQSPNILATLRSISIARPPYVYSNRGYILAFSTPGSAEGDGWIVSVDFTAHGLRVVDFDPVYD